MSTARARPSSLLRRGRAAEWLLLPVFALPFVVAGCAALWFRAQWEATIGGYARDPAAAIERWVGAAPWFTRGDWLRRNVEEGDGSRDWVRFRRGSVAGVVHRPGGGPSDPVWVLADEFAGGLSPRALGDPGVRIAVEAGAPIAAHAGADAPTRALAALLRTPDSSALREVPLRAGTKLHLLERDAAADPRDAAVLRALRDIESALDTAGGRLVPGGHETAAARVLSAGDRVRVIPKTAGPSPWNSEYEFDPDETGTARLRWTPWETPRSDEIVWSGRRATPLAGVWTIDLPDGRAWWNDVRFRTWMPRIAWTGLAFLAIPAALLVALRRRRRLDEARSRFVNEIAHDLRTPVAALRLHADLLASGRVPETEHAKHAGVLGREAARIAALLANLLDVSRLERGATAYVREAVDVSAAVRDAVRDVALLHPARAADLNADVPDGVIATADRVALGRVLVNLLDNAAKFTPPGTPIRVRASAAGHRVRLVVEDEGPGIARSERERVFLPYERGSAAAATAAPGTGLGLALVRELVHGMGGTVRVADGRASRGAVFEIDLPEAFDDRG